VIEATDLAEIPSWESQEGYPRARQPEDTQAWELHSLSLSCPHPLELLSNSGPVECQRLTSRLS